MLLKALSVVLFTILTILVSCSSDPILSYGKHYQVHKDYKSLRQVVDLLELGVDSAYVRSVLGEPIDFGFDFRYLIDSTGATGCAIGAVFHIDGEGKIDDKWLDEICE